MTSADLLPAAVLKRKAVVYVRQSTQAQVQTNLESQRRQYELVDEARRHGFQNVEVIDDDLGRSASGMTPRPGFERLLAWVCAGEGGAVLCFDASRLARNGHDWHHLLELCGLVKARVIDLDGIYDPCRPNDRLLLGMKGSISEFELGVHGIHAYRSAEKNGEWLTMSDAAKLLGVSNHAIRRLIKDGILAAEQVVPDAPYQIRASDLQSQKIVDALARNTRPCRGKMESQSSMFPDT